MEEQNLMKFRRSDLKCRSIGVQTIYHMGSGGNVWLNKRDIVDVWVDVDRKKKLVVSMKSPKVKKTEVNQGVMTCKQLLPTRRVLYSAIQINMCQNTKYQNCLWGFKGCSTINGLNIFSKAILQYVEFFIFIHLKLEICCSIYKLKLGTFHLKDFKTS